MIQQSLGISNKLVVGLVLAAFFLPVPVATMLAPRRSVRRRMYAAYTRLGGGVLLTVVGVLIPSATVSVVASVIASAGCGITASGIMAGIADLTTVADRAQTVPLRFIIAVSALVVPAVVAGMVAQAWNLHDTFVWYGVCEAILVVFAAVAGLRWLRRFA